MADWTASDALQNYIRNNADKNVVYNEPSEEKRNELLKKITEKMDNTFEPIYDNNTPIPGQSFEVDRVYGEKTIKEEAEQGLITGLAMRKLKKEQEANKKKSVDERVKEVYIKGCLQNYITEFQKKYGYQPDGQSKRKIRKQYERGYGKNPKFTPTKEQMAELIDYVNLPSSSPDENKNNPLKNKYSAGQGVSRLISTI